MRAWRSLPSLLLLGSLAGCAQRPVRVPLELVVSPRVAVELESVGTSQGSAWGETEVMILLVLVGGALALWLLRGRRKN